MADSDDKDLAYLPYLRHLRRIVKSYRPRQKMPVEILDHVYLGDIACAHDPESLKALGIDAVVNCAADDITTGEDFYGSDVLYLGLACRDDSTYDVMQHYEEVHTVLERVRTENRKCMVHCVAGVNRSGALVTAYVAVNRGLSLLKAARHVHERRGMLLTNENFCQQLVMFAEKRGILGSLDD